jgi:hypothetical protein
MIYFERKKIYKKIKHISEETEIERQHLYECVRDMENYNLMRFKKTPFGSYLIEEEEIEILKEFSYLKKILCSPKQAAEIIKVKQSAEVEEMNMEWAKGLNFAVWRNF